MYSALISFACLICYAGQLQSNVRAIEITSDLDDIEEVDDDLLLDRSNDLDGLRRRMFSRRELFK